MFGSPLINEGFENLDTNPGDAVCLSNTSETANFSSYINQCRKSIDTSRANNFFSKSIAHYKGIFQQLRAQFDNLIISGDSQSTLASLSGNTEITVDGQINSLTKRREELIYQVKKTRNESQSHDKMFLDDIMHKKEKKELYPTLQDFALGLFIFGWVLMSCVLIFIRASSPGGGWLAGIFTFFILLIISIFLYTLLLYVA